MKVTSVLKWLYIKFLNKIDDVTNDSLINIYNCIYHELYICEKIFDLSNKIGQWKYFYLIFVDKQINQIMGPFYAFNSFIVYNSLLTAISKLLFKKDFI